MIPYVPVPFTVADWNRLPEGFPAQLVAGELLRDEPPTYGHQQVALRVALALVDRVGIRRVSVAPTGVVVDDANAFLPDVVVLRRPPPYETRDVGIPMLAFEVLSPSTAHRDRDVKRASLLASGVLEVWILDPMTESIEVFDKRRRRVATGSERIASHVIRSFSLVPSVVFADPRRKATPKPKLRSRPGR